MHILKITINIYPKKKLNLKKESLFFMRQMSHRVHCCVPAEQYCKGKKIIKTYGFFKIYYFADFSAAKGNICSCFLQYN